MLRARLHPLLLIPLAALITLHPLLVHGVSCGQDMAFHLQSWLDASRQLRSGHYPQWAYSPAWNAGEPRFLFYPPLSWLLGALLSMVLPLAAAPVAFIFLALTASGCAMYHLAKQYVSQPAALLAAVFYLANPYMLFCAFERTAFAELLAAAWMPLLLLAVLRPRPTVRGVAVPIALLWLTNAPAAVMGCYLFAMLAVLRVGRGLYRNSAWHVPDALQLSVRYVAGTVLGLALPAFYLVPAAYQRRYVQVAMAIIPNMRYQDNFLFTQTADAGHNIVNHTASDLAVALLACTAVVLLALILFRRRNVPVSVAPLALTALVVAFLLLPVSSPVWAHLPNLAFLQFPWRLLTVLCPVLAFALALLLDHFAAAPLLRPAPYPLIAVSVAFALCIVGYRLYAQQCDAPSEPASIAALFRSGHGAPPTDEYTPTNADNDLLRTDNPGYWVVSTLNAPAPNTVPTPSEVNPNVDTDDTPIPDSQTLSIPAPHHFTVRLAAPSFLVLNLRDYPNWRVQTSGPSLCGTTPKYVDHLQRDDGLLAIKLFKGCTLDIDWHHTLDQEIGLALSLCALLYLLLSAIDTLRHRPRVEWSLSHEPRRTDPPEVRRSTYRRRA